MSPPTPVEWDVLGEPWTAETIGLPPDDEGPVVATLVRRVGDAPSSRAVLHVHGFSDYFFHVEYAAWWTARGYDVYALDLRKYGRSLRPHQTPTWTTDLRDYHAELDLAWERITVRDGHDQVVVSAHSTGGLVAALWADERRPRELAGMVLNAPWLDLQGSPWLRSVPAGVALDQLGRRQPRRVLIPSGPGLYARSLHRDHGGEWDFDLAWKPVQTFPIRAGWLRAVRRGHARLHRGLDVAAPVLVLSSDRSGPVLRMSEEMYRTDVVLDVRQIRRWSTALGTHVTYVAVPGAVHDVVLSAPEPRARVYDELTRWSDTYLP